MLSDETLLFVLRDKRRVALWGDLLRALAAAILGLIVLATLRYYAFLAQNMFSLWHMNDFGKFYYSTQAFLSGGEMYGPNPATSIPITPELNGYWGNMNPPHFHLLLLPLARLSPLPAVLLWACASAISLIGSFWIIGREVRIRWTAATVVLVICGIVLCSATGLNIATGQVTFLLLLPMTLAWAAARQGRWERAAIWLGILASVKPFLAVFLPYLLLERRWRPAILMGIAAASCITVGVIVFGAANYETWLQGLTSVDWAWAPMNASVEGLMTRVLRPTPLFTALTHAEGLIRPISLLMAVPLVLLTTRKLVHDRSHGPAAIDRAFALLILLALLISPLGWIYYVWLLAGPALALWSARRRLAFPGGLVLYSGVIGLTMPLVVTYLARQSVFGTAAFGSIYFWTLLVLWVTLVRADS